MGFVLLVEQLNILQAIERFSVDLAERKPLIPAEAKAISQNYYEQRFYSAQAFLKIARYCLQEGDLKEGAFNLHQGAKRACNAIILVHAGYKSKTHNLGKLKRYSKRFSEEYQRFFFAS